jgi:hypothetical protein
MQTRFAAFALTALVTLPLAADVVTAGQRAGTITSTSKPAQKKPPATMEERLAAIEKRLDDLENADIDQLEADEDDDAQVKKIQDRIAALEKKTADAPAGSKPASPDRDRGDGPLTVKAPFIVQDASGATIFEVGIAAENNQPALVLGAASGARARLGVTRAGGASLGLYDSSNAVRLAIVGNPADSVFRLGGRVNAVEIGARQAGGIIHVTNGQNNTVATLESRGQHGRFTLADLNGETTVEAGTVVGEGVGVVRAGPDLKGATGAMAGGLVVPRAILGRK